MAKDREKKKANNVEIKYEKLMTQQGKPVLLIQGHIYYRKSKEYETYICKDCKISRSIVHLKDGKITKANLHHENGHKIPSKARIAKFRFNSVKHEYFKDEKNFEKSTKDICEDILKNYSLESLGFANKDKLAKAIYDCKRWVLRKRPHSEISDSDEDEQMEDETMPEISASEEDETINDEEMPEIYRIYRQVKIEDEQMPENSSEIHPQVDLSENSSEIPPQVKSEANLPKNSSASSENSNVPSSNVSSENDALKTLKFIVKEISELLASKVPLDKSLVIKNLSDIRFYFSEIREMLDLNNSNNSLSSEIVEKLEFYVKQINGLLPENQGDSGLISIKNFSKIEFYMKKIGQLLNTKASLNNQSKDENVQNDSTADEKPNLGSVEIPIFID